MLSLAALAACLTSRASCRSSVAACHYSAVPLCLSRQFCPGPVLPRCVSSSSNWILISVPISCAEQSVLRIASRAPQTNKRAWDSHQLGQSRPRYPTDNRDECTQLVTSNRSVTPRHVSLFGFKSPHRVRAQRWAQKSYRKRLVECFVNALLVSFVEISSLAQFASMINSLFVARARDDLCRSLTAFIFTRANFHLFLIAISHSDFAVFFQSLVHSLLQPFHGRLR